VHTEDVTKVVKIQEEHFVDYSPCHIVFVE